MNLDHTNNTEFEDPDELDEDNDWETQQIRKGVTVSQLAAAQQESSGMSALYNNMVIQEQSMIPIVMSQKPRFSDSYAPQAPMTTMNLDDIINKSKEMYIIYNKFIVMKSYLYFFISELVR